MNKIKRNLVLWLTGGIVYFFFEIMVRGYSHISMFVCGGLCFMVVGNIGNKIMDSALKLSNKIFLIMIIGSGIITLFELIAGLYVNIYLGLNVWDYKAMKFNFLGQICLLYSLLWAVLSLPCVFFGGMINRFIFDVAEQK